MSDININHLLFENDELAHFMDEMPGGFFIYRANDSEEILYANKALLRIFQCDTLGEFRQFTGNSFKGLVHPEDLDMVEASIREQICNSQYDLDYVEYRIIRRDGQIRWLEDYGHFIHNESFGDFFYVFVGDATEKRNLLLAERASINQEYLRRLEVIEGLSINYESILYIDLDANQALPYRLSDRTKKQFQQRFQVRDFLWFNSDYINTWVHPDDQELISKMTSPEYIREKLSSCQTYYTNYRVCFHDKILYLQLRIVNVGRTDHISQIVLGHRSVDEEIRREMEQKQILEKALSNANLAIIAKNSFLANMSHDMRTPLNAIFGYTNLAQKNCQDPSLLQEYLSKIDTAGKQLLDLIDKVLEISWLESNDVELSHSPCNLCAMIEELHHYLTPFASSKNIAFSLHTGKLNHPDIYADSDKLRQILLYITSNAITYTKPGGNVTLTVAEPEVLPNRHALYRFEIKDTGIGIKQDFLAHIFEPFEREENTTISGIHGTGLGLTIAKNLVDMMGGSIKVSSTVNKGSTFVVSLTFQLQDTTSDTPQATLPVPSPLVNRKILLVEDNEINQEIESEILLSQGFLVDIADNGSIALEMLSSAPSNEYALILMDIQMPVMNGWQTASAIRSLEDPVLSQIPIIALSANAFESDKRSSLESGMNAHLTKPINTMQLLEEISRVLETPEIK